MTSVLLPAADGSLYRHTLREPARWERPEGPIRSRVAFAAAHVVADPLRDNAPGAPAAVDWDATLAFRAYLWSCGLGVAEAMDTAQRGMGLDWPATRELISRSAANATGRLAAGVGTDHVPEASSLDEVYGAYAEQLEFVQSAGAQPIMMASRQLARLSTSPADYRHVYDRLLAQVETRVILHWLGPMFDPALAGYWGSPDRGSASATFLDLVRDHATRVDGVKVSLLDADHEKRLRAELPDGVRLYTGDDFHYPDLIRGDGARHSDALLGIFAAIAPAASHALQALDRGDETGYDEALAPTVPLAHHLFAPPTYYYKTGIAFLSWICGHQPGFTMVGGLQSARGLPHLVEAFVLADRAGLLPYPDLAAHRVRVLLATHGIDR
ncbi:dihydrodipicolinate synthase family protein [Parafrankia colletiae]|uniref:Dihydrodipicolinate synthase family protein n=1 Tax=Parafrankia colletiae TaxID=573497 RepID=A0A1S1QTA7_9ACTN|nr:dihydrodipicolinate synthase family protein [Parafrankia colletiae]MCK9899626.1 dihydrodipicolinate synthase family protein [Frankia sp. Cpl3]OHV37953.1 dihydrodipicolinate synthase family protein [Parafrankia colletiae]